MLRRLRELRTYLRAERVDEIARRYLVMNAFDGALAVLSIIVSAYFVGAAEPQLIVTVGLATTIAMGISGFTGTYMTERAERLRRLHELEDAMLTDLDKTAFGTASRIASIYAAFIDGIAPMIAAAISLAPLIIAMFFPIAAQHAVYAAIATNLTILFTLGAFLGRISRTNVVVSGLKMVAIGLLTALLCVLMKIA